MSYYPPIEFLIYTIILNVIFYKDIYLVVISFGLSQIKILVSSLSMMYYYLPTLYKVKT